jgi:hypothetical protein
MFTIVSTRFNNETWEQNVNFKIKYNYIGCIYGVPQPMSNKIEKDSPVFVVEMNNTTNKVEGIGLLKNTIYLDKYYKLYDTGDYNRYIFKGKYHLKRDEIDSMNSRLIELLDYILFKEKTHLKRGIGFTTIPEKLLNHEKCKEFDVKNEVKNLFIRVFSI